LKHITDIGRKACQRIVLLQLVRVLFEGVRQTSDQLLKFLDEERKRRGLKD
jgi:hypothetical protein